MTTARALVQHLAVALGVCLLLVAAFSVLGNQPRPEWFAAATVAAAIASVAVRMLGRQLIQTSWPERTEGYAGGQWRHNDSRAQFLATWLQESHHDPDAFARRVQPMLAELVAARLRRRHGIDLETRPDAAREVLGPELWELVTATGPRAVAYAEIQRAVETIENL